MCVPLPTSPLMEKGRLCHLQAQPRAQVLATNQLLFLDSDQFSQWHIVMYQDQMEVTSGSHSYQVRKPKHVVHIFSLFCPSPFNEWMG